MVPYEVLKTYAVTLMEYNEKKNWTYSSIGLHTQDFYEDETVLDAVEALRAIFSDLGASVVVTSDGIVDPQGVVQVSVRFV